MAEGAGFNQGRRNRAMISWAWTSSRHVDDKVVMRAKFVAAAMRAREVSRQFAAATPDSPLGKLLAEWPETIGVLIWPYQCISWDSKERFQRLGGHLYAVHQIEGLQLAPEDKLVLADLSAFSPGVSLIIDRARWLAREGHLTLSLFKDDFRAFTVSFSLSRYPKTELFIGGLQGRNTEEALALYRDLTKDFAGMRPRDFILEMLRLFALKIGVRHIHAVADDHKISRHKYFGDKGTPGLFYDDAWRDRSGERIADTHFELPLQGSRRPLEEVSSKKRSMYRRRYEMLDQIEARMPNDMSEAERRHFDAK
jgi:uncharacterized protein VirK/YbjX